MSMEYRKEYYNAAVLDYYITITLVLGYSASGVIECTSASVLEFHNARALDSSAVVL